MNFGFSWVELAICGSVIGRSALSGSFGAMYFRDRIWSALRQVELFPKTCEHEAFRVYSRRDWLA
jgi:hypothetical protein